MSDVAGTTAHAGRANGDAIALRVADLTIEYASGGYLVRPIENLDLSADGGELVLLLGASGCGKTSLLSVLAGLLTPAAGTVDVGGIAVTKLHGRALTQYRRRTVGVVFQAFNLVPSLTALENVQVPLRAIGMRARDARARAGQLLDQLGLSERSHHRPADLSGGQQQRVAIARAMALDPPLVLADEPTAHLDYVQVDGVIRRLRELADAGHLIIVATHDERLTPIADRMLNLTPRPEPEDHPPEPITLAAGQELFHQGDESDQVYVVEVGAIEIVRDRDDGSEEHLTTVEPGGYFGELGPLLGIRRAGTARARVPTTLTGYSIQDFRTKIRPGTIGELIAGAKDNVRSE